MKHNQTLVLSALVLAVVACAPADGARAATVDREDGKVYIVDRQGERWEVTQAMSAGFKPEKFQFGLGRGAIPPLEDTDLDRNAGEAQPGVRVIGIERAGEARAYSVPRLTRHEIANSRVGEQPIAVAY